MQDLILGLQDHDLSRRQSLNQLSHPGAPNNAVLKILFVHLTEREHKPGEWQEEGEGEADSLLSREPNAGLDPGTPGS